MQNAKISKNTQQSFPRNVVREDEKIVNLRARGLVGIGNIFEKYVEKEMGKESTPSSSQLSSVSTNSANSPTSLSLSQITSNDIERPPNSQLSDSSTITLSSPSQTVDISQESKQVAEKECQTADGVFLEKEE